MQRIAINTWDFRADNKTASHELRILEGMIQFLGIIIHALLWIKVAASPTIAGLVIGFILGGGSPNHLAVLVFGTIGFIAGGLWAERIRKTVGLPAFFGRLISIHEFDDDGDK